MYICHTFIKPSASICQSITLIRYFAIATRIGGVLGRREWGGRYTYTLDCLYEHHQLIIELVFMMHAKIIIF